MVILVRRVKAGSSTRSVCSLPLKGGGLGWGSRLRRLIPTLLATLADLPLFKGRYGTERGAGDAQLAKSFFSSITWMPLLPLTTCVTRRSAARLHSV